MDTSTATALYLDPWAGPVLAFVAAFKTKRNGQRVTRFRWQRADGNHCYAAVFTNPEYAVAAARRHARFADVRG